MRRKLAPTPLSSARTHRELSPKGAPSRALPTAAALAAALAAIGALGAIGALEGCDRGTPSPTPSASRDLASTATPSSTTSIASSAQPAPSTFASTSAAPSGSSSVALAAPCSASVHVVPHVPPTPLATIGGGIGPLEAQMHMAGGAMPVSPLDKPGGTASPPKAQVTQGGSSTTGALTNALAQPVIAKATPRLRACYQKALAADPTVDGVVSFHLVVGAAGEVQSVTTSSTLSSANAADCMKAAMMTLKFPAADGGGSSDVTVPFGFHTSSA